MPIAETDALDVATAVVAGYAAVVATLAFAFNVFSWLRSWQTRVEVDVNHRMLATAGVPPDEHEAVVLFTFVNHSGHPVKVTHVSLAPLRKGGKHFLFPHLLGRPTPGAFEIAARDAVDGWIKVDAIAEAQHDPSFKTRALVMTSDRRTFKSRKVRVAELLGK